MVENFPESSPQRVFWDQQRIYNRLRNKCQMKWHPLILRFVLNLKYMSSSAYRAVRQSGIINLPSERSSSNLASHVFVLMARVVFKPSLCVPVAHYFSSNLKGNSCAHDNTHVYIVYA